MKKIGLFLVFLLTFSFVNAQITENSTEGLLTETHEYKGDGPVYIVCVTVVKDELGAQSEVKKLMKKGYQSGYLWIPSYASLSGAKYYSVFIGPFNEQSDCEQATEAYKKVNKSAYGLLVSQEKTRVQINGVGKVTTGAASTSKDYSKISGKYENSIGLVTIKYKGNNQFSFSLSVGTERGCTGEIEGIGKINSEGVGTYSSEECSSLKFVFSGRTLEMEESGCSGLHGMGCSFDGTYNKK